MLKAVFGSYLSHLAGYVISAVTIVSTLSPDTFPPKYAFVTAVATAIATAFSHGRAVQGNAGKIVAAVADAVTESISQLPTSTASGSTVAKSIVMGLLALPVLFALHGCASVQSWLSSPTGAVVVSAGVEVAVTTAESKGVSAAQINSVAKAVLQADSGANATVTALTAAVNGAAVKAGVPPGDMAAFQILETAFDAWLVTKYGDNATVQNIQADVAAFCAAVIADTGG